MVLRRIEGKPRALARDESATTIHSPPFDGTTGYSALRQCAPSSWFVYIGYVWRNRSLPAPTLLPYGTSLRVQDDLIRSGSQLPLELWNVGRWTCSRIWDEIDHIPNQQRTHHLPQNHERYDDLRIQKSSQRVLQELAEAFNSWYGKRRNGDTRANPPGYRKHGDDHPRSTVTFKAAGFKLDTQYNRVRLSKGSNLKAYWSDFTLCEVPDAARC